MIIVSTVKPVKNKNLTKEGRACKIKNYVCMYIISLSLSSSLTLSFSPSPITITRAPNPSLHVPSQNDIPVMGRPRFPALSIPPHCCTASLSTPSTHILRNTDFRHKVAKVLLPENTRRFQRTVHCCYLTVLMSQPVSECRSVFYCVVLCTGST